jgi:hypothetical protein
MPRFRPGTYGCWVCRLDRIPPPLRPRGDRCTRASPKSPIRRCRCIRASHPILALANRDRPLVCLPSRRRQNRDRVRNRARILLPKNRRAVIHRCRIIRANHRPSSTIRRAPTRIPSTPGSLPSFPPPRGARGVDDVVRSSDGGGGHTADGRIGQSARQITE